MTNSQLKAKLYKDLSRFISPGTEAFDEILESTYWDVVSSGQLISNRKRDYDDYGDDY